MVPHAYAFVRSQIEKKIKYFWSFNCIYIYILELASKLMCPRDGSGCGEFGPSSGAILGPLASHDASCVPARKPSQARLLEKAL